jgi:hypothetical protein
LCTVTDTQQAIARTITNPSVSNCYKCPTGTQHCIEQEQRDAWTNGFRAFKAATGNTEIGDEINQQSPIDLMGDKQATIYTGRENEDDYMPATTSAVQ